MVGDELVEESMYEKLESDALGDITQKDKIVALAHRWDVFLFDWWGLWKVGRQHLVDPEQVLALISCAFVRQLALPVKLLYTEVQRCCSEYIFGSVSLCSMLMCGPAAWYCSA